MKIGKNIFKLSFLLMSGVGAFVPSAFAGGFGYFAKPVISEVQAKVSKIIEGKYLNKDRSNLDHTILYISSDRAHGEKPTEIEKILDKAVEKNDLPVKSFYLKELSDYKAELDSKNRLPGKEADFVIVHGVGAARLYKRAESESMVQLASQFNALESVNAYFSPVKDWIYDYTQGPACALQAIAACKHRESAYLKNKLPDAITELLEGCKVKDGKGKYVPITKKYPYLYKNGYLSLRYITDTYRQPENKSLFGNILAKLGISKKDKATSAQQDLFTLEKYLKENIGKLKFLVQWVKCENSDNIQLQVFTAAPDCSGIGFKRPDEKTNCINEICKTLVVGQYRALGQAAAIRSVLAGKCVPIHLTMVGQGVFCNPPIVIKEAIKALVEEVRGYGVKVFLHSYTEISTNRSIEMCNDLGIKFDVQY